MFRLTRFNQTFFVLDVHSFHQFAGSYFSGGQSCILSSFQSSRFVLGFSFFCTLNGWPQKSTSLSSKSLAFFSFSRSPLSHSFPAICERRSASVPDKEGDTFMISQKVEVNLHAAKLPVNSRAAEIICPKPDGVSILKQSLKPPSPHNFPMRNPTVWRVFRHITCTNGTKF